MKRQRAKYRARNDRHARLRAAWLDSKYCCQVCMQAPAREVHHIAGRNAAARDSIAQKYEDKKNWLAVCRVCHSAVDKETPAVTACAAKLLAGELDLRYLQDLRPGKRFAVSLGDLAQACDNLKEWIDVKKLRGKM